VTVISVALDLEHQGGGMMAHAGCGSVEGLWRNRSRDLKNPGWQVLQVKLGEWRPQTIVEKTHVPLVYKILRDQVPKMHYVHIGLSEVV